MYKVMFAAIKTSQIQHRMNKNQLSGYKFNRKENRNMIIVNFKTYSQATGKKARKLAEDCIKAARETGEKVVVAPAVYDMVRLQELGVEVFSQHVDYIKPGSHTGHVIPEGVKEAGASGTLINHSERRLEKEQIIEAVNRARELGLTTVVCTQDLKEFEKLSKLKPDYIAYEPPELIGGDTSVSEARPGMIEQAVENSEVPVLTGAGICTSEDVEKSIENGAEGVLVASGVVKSEDPYKRVKELCKGL